MSALSGFNLGNLAHLLGRDRHRKREGTSYLRGVGAECFGVGGELTPKKWVRQQVLVTSSTSTASYR